MELAQYPSLLCKFYLLQDCNFLQCSCQFSACWLSDLLTKWFANFCNKGLFLILNFPKSVYPDASANLRVMTVSSGKNFMCLLHEKPFKKECNKTFNLHYCNHKFMVMLSLSIYLYMVCTTEQFLEVATESWPEWDLNPWPMNSVQLH